MLIEILELAAALEWIALGVLVYLKARSLSRRLDALCGKLPIGPGPDPAGKKGPWGICPECGAVGYCYWDEKQIRARVWRAGTKTTALSAERMAGISGHALSGQMAL